MTGNDEEQDRGLNILLVEDNPINRKITRQLLDRFGHTVSMAENGQQAVDAIENDPLPDIILMDRHMPVMDGIEATRRIRALDGHRKAVPIIALTGTASDKEISICLEAGMNDFIAKPIDPEKLEATLREAVSGKVGATKTARLSQLSGETDAPVLDMAVVDRLHKDFGAEAKADFFDMFAEIGPEAVAGYKDAVKANDTAEMIHHVHDLKSSAANIGLKRLSVFCARLEQYCEDGNVDEARALETELGDQLEAALRALNDLTSSSVSDHNPQSEDPTEIDSQSGAQSGFLSKMSHELRNEMNAITGNLFMLRQGTGQDTGQGISPEDLAEHAAEVRDSGARIQALAENMEILIKLQAENYDVVPEWITVDPLIKDCVNNVLQYRDRALSVSLENDLPLVQADQKAFRTVMDNLLANACLASLENGEIRLTAVHTSDTVRLEIWNQGESLAASEVDQLLSPWGGTYSDTGDNSAQETLIYLRYAVAHRLMALQHGRLELSLGAASGTIAIAVFQATI
jgi:CheY-like chemotaxis protein/HPt (histidine-containing phosphotransfer) domain-containing protein